MSHNHSFTTDNAPRREYLGRQANGYSEATQTCASDRLTAWFSGELALTRSEAHRLLESAVRSDQMAQCRPEFVAAIKALAAGSKSWGEMGYRLLPDA